MRKTLLLWAFVCVSVTTFHAQTISIVGEAVGGWPDNDPNTPDTHIMTTTDNENYTLLNLTVTTAAATEGGAKFRQDGAWTTNWGNSNFPNGTATQNGSNIQTIAGVYDVAFNRITGVYSFTNVQSFPGIGILGTAVSAGGFDGPDADLFTSDGINYTLNNFTFMDGQAKFRQNDAWTNSWGSNSFPSGTALLNNPDSNIPVVAGTYNVSFNSSTLAYNFAYVSIGIIGTVLGPTGFDGADVDLTTTDGVNYTLSNYPLANGLLKFRQDNAWTVNWGGSSSSETAVANGNDIAISPAGNYDISFNRNTLAYTVTETLGIKDVATVKTMVYPNPTSENWHFSVSEGSIASVTIVDVLGKTIHTQQGESQNIVVNAAGFPPGIYFAQIASELSIKTIKLLKI